MGVSISIWSWSLSADGVPSIGLPSALSRGGIFLPRMNSRPSSSIHRSQMMKKLILAAAMAALMTSTAHATKIGVSMALFDDNFLTVLRNGIQAYADKNGIDVQIEDAQNDVAKQLDQIKNFAASGVDAIIVNPVDTSATKAMSDAAAAAGVPLVYVNREPVNVDSLPDNQAFVASDEREAGTLE